MELRSGLTYGESHSSSSSNSNSSGRSSNSSTSSMDQPNTFTPIKSEPITLNEAPTLLAVPMAQVPPTRVNTPSATAAVGPAAATVSSGNWETASTSPQPPYPPPFPMTITASMLPSTASTPFKTHSFRAFVKPHFSSDDDDDVDDNAAVRNRICRRHRAGRGGDPGEEDEHATPLADPSEGYMEAAFLRSKRKQQEQQQQRQEQGRLSAVTATLVVYAT